MMNHASRLVRLLLATGLCVPVVRAVAEEAPSDIDPQAEKLLREMDRYLLSMESFRVDIDILHLMTGHNREYEYARNVEVAFQAPNRVRVESDGYDGAYIFVSNGESYTAYSVTNKRYTTGSMPKSIDFSAAKEAGLSLALGTSVGENLAYLLFDDADTMEGIMTASYKGTEMMDGIRLCRVRCVLEDSFCDVWFTDEEYPLISRLQIDRGQGLPEKHERGQYLNIDAYHVTIDFENWQPGVSHTADTFEFTPPEDAVEVNDLTDPVDDIESEYHAMEGETAPEFTLKDLEDNEVSLADHKGEHVLLIEFWATWCPPCVEALPHMAELAEKYAEKGVRFYAINQQESPSVVKKFLEKKKLDVNVLLDPDSKVSNAYGVSGIPQTVIIDKKGIIQAVHTGYGSAMDATLARQLEQVLEGKTIARTPPPIEVQTSAGDLETDGLEHLWTIPGQWSGVVADSENRVIYVSAMRGRCVQLDPDGQVIEEFKFGYGGTLRLAKLDKDEKPEVLGFQLWRDKLIAATADGEKLWEYPCESGIDDARPGDLDGDGLDEVAIGHNGSTGLHVLKPNGELFWKYTDIGNVWHVDIGDVTGDGQAEVVTTSAIGNIHLFDSTGKKIKDIATSSYSNALCLVPDPKGEGPMRIVTDGSSILFGNRVWLFDEGGRVINKVNIGRAHVASISPAETRPWVAVGLNGGTVKVVDFVKARVTANIEGLELRPQATFLEPAEDDEPVILVVADGARVSAFRVGERDKSTSTEPAE